MKNFKLSSVLAVALLAAAALPSAASADSAANSSKATKWVHLKGSAVGVGALEKVLAGAKIGVAENSKWQTTMKADGSYDLKVPALTTITRYFEFGDHQRIYEPTIRTTKTGAPPWSTLRVPLPTAAAVQQFADLVEIETASGRNAPKDCVVVQLVALKEFETMTPAQIRARHNLVGVAGAKLTVSPAKGIKPLYIGAGLKTDLTQTVTGEDGFGVYFGVQPGTYKFSATKAGDKFSAFTATCKPGRVIFGEIGQQDGDQDD